MSTATTRVMGILNVTPDSFYTGSRATTIEEAVRRAHAMAEEGADLLDVGGESTRPGSESVSVEEEIDRVVPVVERLAKELPSPLSIDTTKPEVARAAVSAGARIVNDISGGSNPEMLDVVSRGGAGIIIMHMRGTPKTMQQLTSYADVVNEVKQFLAVRAAAAIQAGIREVIIDPGLGFAKTADHNFLLLRRLFEFRDLGYPILVGASRKSFLGAVTGGLPPEERLEASLAAATIAAVNGAAIIRTHDVRATWRALRAADAIRNV